MSSAFPLITEWIRKKEGWIYIHESKMRATPLAPDQELDIPYADKVYVYPEMVICSVVAMFDSPLCGMRFRWEPEYDSGRDFTVQNLMIGSSPTDPLIYAKAPPDLPPGLFLLHLPSFWAAVGSAQFSVFNTDTSRHFLLGHGYVLAAKKSKRKVK